MDFKKSTLTLAVAALCSAPLVYAENSLDLDLEVDADLDATATYHENVVKVNIDKDTSVDTDVDIEGTVYVEGYIRVDSAASAVIDDKQINHDNTVDNTHTLNNATVDENALKGASGNIGVNVAAGDNNMQDNAAAMAAADASFVFASSDAEVFAFQRADNNAVHNAGMVNNATLNSHALENAQGNIGVNVAAGDSNLQKNNMAVSVANASQAQAVVSSQQRARDNYTSNNGRLDTYTDRTYVTMSGTVSDGEGANTLGVSVGAYEGLEAGLYAGNEGGTYAGSTGGQYAGSGSGGYTGSGGGSYAGRGTGTYTGVSDQIGNVYPDIWTNREGTDPHEPHPNGTSSPYHMDLDTRTQGGSDLNGDGGALAFNEDGTISFGESGQIGFRESGRLGFNEGGIYRGSERGEYSGSEAGVYGGVAAGRTAAVEVTDIELEAQMSGWVTTVRNIWTPMVNNATLSDNALAGASGNIGVNIAAGTNNMQNNSLAISAVYPGSGGGSPGEQ